VQKKKKLKHTKKRILFESSYFAQVKLFSNLTQVCCVTAVSLIALWKSYTALWICEYWSIL